jgi:hypothetical protein
MPSSSLSCTLPVSQKIFAHVITHFANPDGRSRCLCVHDIPWHLLTKMLFCFAWRITHGLRYYFSPKGWVRSLSRLSLFRLLVQQNTLGPCPPVRMSSNLTNIQKLLRAHVMSSYESVLIRQPFNWCVCVHDIPLTPPHQATLLSWRVISCRLNKF